jgi:hypothetical protein
MPCASRSWRGFSTRHPWRDEKASAPASPPAGPIPPCPAMLGALQGGFTATATATAEAKSKAKSKAAAQSAAAFDLVFAVDVDVALAFAVDVHPHCMAPSIAAISGGSRHGCRLSAVRPWMACPRGTPEIARSAGHRLALLFLASRRHAAGRIPLVTFLGRSRKVTRATARNSSMRPDQTARLATLNPSICDEYTFLIYLSSSRRGPELELRSAASEGLTSAIQSFSSELKCRMNRSAAPWTKIPRGSTDLCKSIKVGRPSISAAVASIWFHSVDKTSRRVSLAC